jgi:hypothetical protein
VRGKLLWVGGAMLLVIGFAWFGASRLLRRLGESESNLRTLFEAAPFPMILAERGLSGVTQANQAAKTYLALEPDTHRTVEQQGVGGTGRRRTPRRESASSAKPRS